MIIKEIVNEVKQTTTVSDILCDMCGKSCEEVYGIYNYMTLRASWGYGSTKDLEIWEAEVCESCVDEHFKEVKFTKTSSISGRDLSIEL